MFIHLQYLYLFVCVYVYLCMFGYICTCLHAPLLFMLIYVFMRVLIDYTVLRVIYHICVCLDEPACVPIFAFVFVFMPVLMFVIYLSL